MAFVGAATGMDMIAQLSEYVAAKAAGALGIFRMPPRRARQPGAREPGAVCTGRRLLWTLKPYEPAY
ncbi:MAG: hypothetical protein ACYCV6_10805 [Steroidobacteraceae bacterium]